MKMKSVRLCWGGAALLVVFITFCSHFEEVTSATAAQPSASTSSTLNNKIQRGVLGGPTAGRNLRRSHRSKFPLIPVDGRRKSKRNSECRLGKNVHEIGDSWNPDLGEPFGIMHCIECACEAVQRKRRIVGRIRCRNIKSECPKLECSDAVSVPGKCCKTCPEVLKSSDPAVVDEIDSPDNNREYAALLTPRSSSLIKSSTGLGEPLTAGLASARFMFLHKSLYYSFVHNDDILRPKFVQFVDSEGNVVEEQEVTINNYQQDTKKICGVWKKMPRVYRKLLKEEKLFAALVTEKINGDNERFLAGRVAKQRYMTNELYSSLLEPANQVETGGMALIHVSSSTGSMYLNVVFNGDFKEERDITISVRIADSSGSGVEESVKIPKIQYDTNSIEVRTILELDQLKSLSRGTLFIVVYSPKNPDFKLIGFIQARATCDIFDTVLAPEDAQAVTSGLAWVYPLPDGSWSYNIQLPEEHNPTTIKIETGRKSLEDLPFTIGTNMTREVVSGMSSRYFQLLYEENIYINIVTDKTNLRGRLVYRRFGDAQLSDAPMILEPSFKNQNDLRTQGLVWIGIDSDCGLSYQLTLNERPQSDLMRLELIETPGLQIKGLPVQSYVLDNFEASQHEGVFTELEKLTFAHIKAGDALFNVVRVNDSSVLASTVIKNVRVPTSCLPYPVRIPTSSTDYTLDPGDEDSTPLPQNKCFYDGKLHEENSQWTPANNTCQICNCFKGQAKCEAVVCPATDCVNPVLLTGECCRSCLNTERPDRNRGRGCDVEGERFHPAGTSWHPYMPPNGFMVCTTCSCNMDTLKVECAREQCPTLNCNSNEAVFPRPLSCCKVCPPKKHIDPEEIADQVSETTKGPTEAEILAAGGCKFMNKLHKNGDEWNHRIEPFGYMPCIICSCNDGEPKCTKKKCPSLDNCEVRIQDEGDCCPRCGSPSDTLARLSPSKPSSSSSRYMGKPNTKHRPKSILQ